MARPSPYPDHAKADLCSAVAPCITETGHEYEPLTGLTAGFARFAQQASGFPSPARTLPDPSRMISVLERRVMEMIDRCCRRRRHSLEAPDCAKCRFEFTEMSISRGEKSMVTVSAELRGALLGIATELEGGRERHRRTSVCDGRNMVQRGRHRNTLTFVRPLAPTLSRVPHQKAPCTRPRNARIARTRTGRQFR